MTVARFLTLFIGVGAARLDARLICRSKAGPAAAMLGCTGVAATGAWGGRTLRFAGVAVVANGAVADAR